MLRTRSCHLLPRHFPWLSLRACPQSSTFPSTPRNLIGNLYCICAHCCREPPSYLFDVGFGRHRHILGRLFWYFDGRHRDWLPFQRYRCTNVLWFDAELPGNRGSFWKARWDIVDCWGFHCLPDRFEVWRSVHGWHLSEESRQSTKRQQKGAVNCESSNK